MCFVFAFYSLDTLVRESHEIVYEKGNETRPVQYLVCEKLSDFHLNKTKINLKKMRDDLYRHIDSLMNENVNWRNFHLKKIKELFLNRTRTGSYLILKEFFCFFANNREELRKIYQFLFFGKVLFAIKRDTFDFVRMKDSEDKIDRLVVLRKGPPYSDCDRSNSRFFCLNDCFKRRARLARYYFEENEIGVINLNHNERNGTIKENEKICFEECNRENCKIVQLISKDLFKEKSNSEIFEAQLKLSEFDFWIQFIGLICSFAGLSIHDFTSIAIEFIGSKVRRKKLRIALVGLKWTILLLGLASFGYLGTQMILKYKGSNLAEKETKNFIQPKIVRLAICVFIDRNLNSWYEGKRMSEIEKATQGALDDALESINQTYQGKSYQVDYLVQPKVLFKDKLRCFLFSIHPDYPTITSNLKLKIKFKKFHFFEIRLLSTKENLNSDSFKYSNRFDFQKRIVKRLRISGRCVDYEEKYRNCMSRRNCVERCIGRKLVERYNRTNFGTDYNPLVLDRDWFSPNEWNTSKLIEIKDEDEEDIYKSISDECLQEIPDEKPCNEIKFEETIETDLPDYPIMEIDLQLHVLRSAEKETSSWYKLAVDLINLQSILFGFTVLKLLRITFNFIQTRLRIRENKIVWFLIYLLCSIGASWHTYHTLHLVVSGELVSTRYYELAKQIEMPGMVFCFGIDQNLIDRNQKLTGAYLGESTADSMIRSINYLNELNEWIPLDLNKVKRFVLLDIKCFRFKIDQVYHRNQFHFTTESRVLKINFTSYAKSKFVYFLTDSKETKEFSKIVILRYYKDYLTYKNITTYSILHKYSITHETSLYKYADRFSFIRKHFSSSFQEDDAAEFDGQLLKMSKAQQLIVYNHLKKYPNLGSDFRFNLVFLRNIVFSTNEENLGKLILSLLNVLFIWFNLSLIDLHPTFILFHDHLLVHLYLHLPVFFFDKTKLICFKIVQFGLFVFKWLKKFKLSLDELLRKQTSEPQN